MNCKRAWVPMEIIVVEVKLLTSNMSNCWSTGSNWFSCGVVYFYKFILPLMHRFGRHSQKRTKQKLRSFLSIAKAMAYHHRTKCGVYHQGRRAAFVSHHTFCVHKKLSQWWYTKLLLMICNSLRNWWYAHLRCDLWGHPPDTATVRRTIVFSCFTWRRCASIPIDKTTVS